MMPAAAPRHDVYPAYRSGNGPLRCRATTDRAPSAPMTAPTSSTALRQLRPHAVRAGGEPLDCDAVAHSVREQRTRQHVGQRRAPHEDQRFSKSTQHAIWVWPAQPGPVAPAHSAAVNPAAGPANIVAHPDLVECGERVGPDGDPGA